MTRPISELDLEAPESVRSLIRKKIEALEDEDRRALLYGSVEGSDFRSSVLAKLLGADDVALEERLARLDRTYRLIRVVGEEELPDGTLCVRYRFVHALYQNVLYADLVSTRRIFLHRQAGERLVEHFREEAPRIATQLAMHFELGRDFGRAVKYLIHAGDNAAWRYANAEAEAHFSHALQLLGKLPVEQQAERNLTLYQKRGRANFGLARFDAAEEDFQQMLAHAKRMGEPSMECAALNALADTAFYARTDLEAMGAWAEQSLEAAERSGSEKLRVEATVLLGFKHVFTGRLVEATRILDEALPIAKALQHKPALLRGLVCSGARWFFQSEYSRDLTTLAEALTLASEMRDGLRLVSCLFFRGMSLGNLGRMSEALATFDQALKMAERDGHSRGMARVMNCVGWIHRELQDFQGALQHDQASVEICRRTPFAEAEANAQINLSLDYLQSGDAARARTALSAADAIDAPSEFLRWRFRSIRLPAAQAQYWLSVGGPNRASEAALKLLENATRHGARKYMAEAHRLLAEAAMAVGDSRRVQSELQLALEQLNGHPAPLVAWKVWSALGRLQWSDQDCTAAREAYSHAADIAQTIASNVSDERLRSIFLGSAAVREILDRASLPPTII